MVAKEGEESETHDKIDSDVKADRRQIPKMKLNADLSEVSDLNLHSIAQFLNKMSKRDKVLMSNMHKVAQNSVEQELHKAATRKMAREEAAWYACSWLLGRCQEPPMCRFPRAIQWSSTWPRPNPGGTYQSLQRSAIPFEDFAKEQAAIGCCQGKQRQSPCVLCI